MDALLLIEVNAFTHQGRMRADNEDSITVAGWVSDVAMTGPRRSRHELTEPFLVAVADGMGGHAAGEVASRRSSGWRRRALPAGRRTSPRR